MTTDAEKMQGGGWGWPTPTAAHLFTRFRLSLCGKWILHGEFSPAPLASQEACAVCLECFRRISRGKPKLIEAMGATPRGRVSIVCGTIEM